MKEVLTRVLSVIIYFVFISIVTFVASWILGAPFKDAIIPVALSFIITDIVGFQLRLSKMESDVKDIVKQAESRIGDRLKFETNARVIGDNLNSISKGSTDMRVMELEREIEKLKMRKV